MKRSITQALVFCAGLLSLGMSDCGDAPNSLEGTISESHSLDFDRTELRRYAGALQLDYLKDVEGGDPEVILKIVINIPEGGIENGVEIDILENGGIMERRASDNLDYPDIERGFIIFETGGNEPGPTAGEFASTFVNGKTLNGTFDVELVDVEF